MTDNISNLAAEIAKAKQQAAVKIAKLKRAAAAEQRRIDGKVVDLLRDQKLDLYERLTLAAIEALAADKATRAGRAKKGTLPTSSVHEEAASWNG